jgi:uncharacterized protein (TIGR00159 family)
MQQILGFLKYLQNNWAMDILDISLLFLIIYYILKLFRGTRAMAVLKGLFVFGLLSLAAQMLELRTINWMVEKFWPALVVAVVIIFQPELRRGLAQIGQRQVFGTLIQGNPQLLDEIVSAAVTLSKRRIGALIVIEREADLQRFTETGTKIDALVKEELITTIFTPYSPLHDGAIIIQNDRVMAASCLLPLSDKSELEASFGTRHRAAIGLSEEVDAVVIIVSEETGNISVSLGGKMTRNLDQENLKKVLSNIFSKA